MRQRAAICDAVRNCRMAPHITARCRTTLDHHLPSHVYQISNRGIEESGKNLRGIGESRKIKENMGKHRLTRESPHGTAYCRTTIDHPLPSHVYINRGIVSLTTTLCHTLTHFAACCRTLPRDHYRLIWQLPHPTACQP